MEIKYIFKLLLKWLWLIILIPGTAGFGAYYVSVYKTIPVYEAMATMCIVTPIAETRVTAVYGDINSAQNAVRNYGDMIRSNTMINEALAELGLNEYSAARFKSNISLVNADRSSFVVGLRVVDVDPRLAAEMANKITELFVDKANKLIHMPVIEILDWAEIPTRPVRNEIRKNVGVAVMAGILFCAVIIFIVEYSGSVIIKDVNDVQKYLEIPVLAAIPDMKGIKHLKINSSL